MEKNTLLTTDKIKRSTIDPLTIEKKDPKRSRGTLASTKVTLLTKEWLQKQVEDGRFVDDIAKELDLKYTTVYNQFKKHNIEPNKKNKYKTYDVSKEWLEEKLAEGTTQHELCCILDTNYETLKRILERHSLYGKYYNANIERRKEKKYIIEKEVFLDLIKNKKYTSQQLMDELDLDPDYLKDYIKRYQLVRFLQSNENEEEENKLIDLIKSKLEKGSTVQEIADLLGKMTYQIGYLIRKHGLNKK